MTRPCRTALPGCLQLFVFSFNSRKEEEKNKLLQHIRLENNMNYSNIKSVSFSMCFVVAFRQICPAGKGYYLQSITETLAFPGSMFPIKVDFDGESWKPKDVKNNSNVSTCKSFELIAWVHMFNFSLWFLFTEPEQRVRHDFSIQRSLVIFAGVTSFFGPLSIRRSLQRPPPCSRLPAAPVVLVSLVNKPSPIQRYPCR